MSRPQHEFDETIMALIWLALPLAAVTMVGCVIGFFLIAIFGGPVGAL